MESPACGAHIRLRHPASQRFEYAVEELLQLGVFRFGFPHDGFAAFLSCRALSSPTTCQFIPAFSEEPTIRPESPHPAIIRTALPTALSAARKSNCLSPKSHRCRRPRRSPILF